MLRLGLPMVAAPITDDWILISPFHPQQQLYTFEIKKEKKIQLSTTCLKF